MLTWCNCSLQRGGIEMKRSTTIIMAAVLAATVAVSGCGLRYYHGPREKGTNYYPLLTTPFGAASDSQRFWVWVLNSSDFAHCYVNIQEHLSQSREFFDFARGDTVVYPNSFSPDEDDLTVTVRFPCDDCVDSLGWHTVTRQFPISGLAPPQRLLVLNNELLMWGEEKQPGQVTNTRNIELIITDAFNNQYPLARFATHEYTETVSGREFWILCQPMSRVDRWGRPAVPVKKIVNIDKLKQLLRRGPDGKMRRYGWSIDIVDLPEEWFPYSTPPTAR